MDEGADHRLTRRRGRDPHIRYADFDSRSYGVISLSPSEAVCEFKAPATALQENSQVSSLAKFRVEAGTPNPSGSRF